MKLFPQYPSKRVFITGAGSGLGRSLAKEFAKNKWTIGITDISDTNLDRTREEIEQNGGSCMAFCFNVSQYDAYSKALSTFLISYNGIDVIINNAGVGEGTLFEDYALEDWEWIIGVNLKGVLYGCQLAVPVMKKQGYGHIINIGSAAGFANLPKMSPYNVTKAAVISLSESLWFELKPFKVKVSVATPAFFQSEILKHARGATEIKEKANKVLTTARWNAEMAALQILKKAQMGKFQIIFPFEGKVLWWLKRISPSLFRFVLSKFLS